MWLGQTVYLIGTPPEEQKFGFMREREKNRPRFITDASQLASLLAKTSGNMYIAGMARDFDKIRSEMRVELEELARARNMALYRVVRK